MDTTNGDLYHGGTISYTTFGTWGKGDEGDKILKCYTFDLFTLGINIQRCFFFIFFCGCLDVCHRTESDLFLFVSLNNTVIPCVFLPFVC